MEDFVTRFPTLWHAAALGSWDSIQRNGLRTAAQLIDAAEGLTTGERQRLHTTVRADSVELVGEGKERVVLRDQGRLLVRRDLRPILGDGLTVGEWVLLLNCRAYLFGNAREMAPLLKKYSARVGQDVIEVDTHRLVECVGGRLEVADQNAGAVARVRRQQKFRHTFRPLSRFDPGRPVREITIVDGVDDITNIVRNVVRYHPDGSREQLG